MVRGIVGDGQRGESSNIFALRFASAERGVGDGKRQRQTDGGHVAKPGTARAVERVAFAIPDGKSALGLGVVGNAGGRVNRESSPEFLGMPEMMTAFLRRRWQRA